MSRLTGSEAKNLMEAYNSVYVSNEDATWVEVENYVNALLEEGHDLSDYTWEDMYEAYFLEIEELSEQLDEQSRPSGPQRRALRQQRSADAAAIRATELKAGGGQAAVQQNLQQRYGGRTPSARQLGRHSSGSSAVRSVAATGRENLFRGGGGDAAMARGLTRQEVMAQGVKNFQANKPSTAPGAPTRPTAPAPQTQRPTAPAPQTQRPTAPAPAADAKTPPAAPAAPAGGIQRRTLTSAELKAAQQARADARAAGKSSADVEASAIKAVSDLGKKQAPAPATGKPAASAPVDKPLANVPRNAARAEGPLKTPGKPVVPSSGGATPAARPAGGATPAGGLTPVQKKGNYNGPGKPVVPSSGGATPAARPAPARPAPASTAQVGKPAVPATGPAPKLSQRAQALKAGGPQKSAREKMLNQDLDLFDIVKGYLLDEGFAETEEAALTIMANMSNEWMDSIVEAPYTLTNADKKANTPAWQNRNKVGVDGKRIYVMAPHLKGA